MLVFIYYCEEDEERERLLAQESACDRALTREHWSERWRETRSEKSVTGKTDSKGTKKKVYNIYESFSLCMKPQYCFFFSFMEHACIHI